MKKIWLLWAVLAISMATCMTFAQNVWWISVSFCNDGKQTKSLSMMADAGVDTEICMDFANSSENDVTINYGFVDGTVTADQYKNKACKNEWDIEKFGQYVTQDTKEILVPSMQVVRQKAHVKFPAWLSGLINWCLTYYVKNEWWSDGSMFNVLIRKASFVDVLVWWEMKRWLQLSESDPVSYTYDKKTKNYTVYVSLDNLWTVDESVSLSGTISNNFGYTADIETVQDKIPSDSTAKLALNVWEIPRYKMTYHIDLSVVSTPSFVFSEDLVPDNLKQSKNIDISLSIFVFPRVVIYGLIWLIVLILIIRFLAKHLSFK